MVLTINRILLIPKGWKYIVDIGILNSQAIQKDLGENGVSQTKRRAKRLHARARFPITSTSTSGMT